ncbi:MAG TPA: methyltransferase domain-containing protein [Caldilineaceae bacterium]|nr:methyltransferase domain-containing protein [Caldilineaceae bacterium]
MAAALDHNQYTPGEIAKYEAVYGRNFVSPGGLASAQECTALLGLAAGMRVLDIGCGLGGSAFYMAERYGAQVQGIDLSANMLHIAQERCRAAGLAERVHFVHGDILDYTAVQPFDRVYSRDVFLHIQDKPRLLQGIWQLLTPGGRLLFTDYCCGEEAKSAGFAAYIRQRGYDLRTVAAYRDLLAEAGFTEITAQDRSSQFLHILEQELANLAAERFTPAALAEIRQSWQAKIARTRSGEQRWGLFIAHRPQ